MVGLSINPRAGRSLIDQGRWTKITDKIYGVCTWRLRPYSFPKQASSFVNAFQDYQYRKGKATPGVDFVMFMF